MNENELLRAILGLCQQWVTNTSGSPPVNLTLPIIDDVNPQELERLFVTPGTWDGNYTITYLWANLGGGTSTTNYFDVPIASSGNSAVVFVRATGPNGFTEVSVSTNPIVANGLGPCVLKLYGTAISGSLNDPVSDYPDKSGNSDDATQADSNLQPVLIPNVWNQYSGVKSDAFNDYMDVPSLNYGTQFTIFAVVIPWTTQSDFVRLFEIGGYNVHSAITAGGSPYGTNANWAFEVNGSGPVFGGTIEPGRITLLACRYSGTTASLRVNGVAIDSKTATAPASGTHAARLFSYIGSPSLYGAFTVLEICCYNNINGTDFSTIESTFLSRYGISYSVPTGTKFLLPTFYGDTNETFRLLGGQDGINFNDLLCHLTPNSGTVRDPALLLHNGDLYCAITTGAFGPSTSFEIHKASGLTTNFSYLCTVDCSAISPLATTWSPIWFVNPDDGAVYILISLGASSNADFKQYYITPSNSNLDAWGTPTEIAGVAALYPSSIAGFIYKKGASFKMLIDDQVGVCNALLQSSTPFSGWSVEEDCATLGLGTNTCEGVWRVVVSGSLIRRYMDYFHAGTGMHYQDSTDNESTYTTPVPITILTANPVARNGVGILLP